MTRDPTRRMSLKDDLSAATTKVVDGARLRQVRLARGLTQEDLANKTGVSRSAVAQWETGRAGLVDKLQKIAVALDVSTRTIRPAAASADERPEGYSQGLENDLVNDFRCLTVDDQAIVTRLARRLKRDTF